MRTRGFKSLEIWEYSMSFENSKHEIDVTINVSSQLDRDALMFENDLFLYVYLFSFLYILYQNFNK